MIVADGPISADAYFAIRGLLFEAGYRSDWEWSETVEAPATAECFACEYTWVVLNSGMKSTIARKIMDKVWPALNSDGSAGAVFGHRGKSAAIDGMWRARGEYFAAFRKLTDETAKVEWCGSLRWIGKITKWHLAKNLGVNCAKPDRWLARLASVSDETVEGLCQRLASATGDRIATVDLVLWRACAVGILRPQAAS